MKKVKSQLEILKSIRGEFALKRTPEIVFKSKKEKLKNKRVKIKPHQLDDW
jgi:hypothetical protein